MVDAGIVLWLFRANDKTPGSARPLLRIRRQPVGAVRFRPPDFTSMPRTALPAQLLTALLLSALPAAAAPAAAPAAADPALQPMTMNTNISEAQVLQAQRTWCEALLSISRAYRSGGASQARAAASKVIDGAYGYVYGPVAFKPTLTSGQQTFRPTREGALAYFVGGDSRFPADSGFALKPWDKCAVRNQVLQLHGDLAITMGNVDLTDSSGKVTTVDKTWSFLREPDGQIRIVLHHSSLPYQPAPLARP
jgi:hypothetical protein